jgi:hypothetical protein
MSSLVDELSFSRSYLTSIYVLILFYSDQSTFLTEFTSVTAMLLVVLQAVRIKIHFGELLLSALLCYLKINHDM